MPELHYHARKTRALNVANLNGANLQSANLTYAFFGGATLVGTNLSGADLGDASFYQTAMCNGSQPTEPQRDYDCSANG